MYVQLYNCMPIHVGHLNGDAGDKETCCGLIVGHVSFWPYHLKWNFGIMRIKVNLKSQEEIPKT